MVSWTSSNYRSFEHTYQAENRYMWSEFFQYQYNFFYQRKTSLWNFYWPQVKDANSIILIGACTCTYWLVFKCFNGINNPCVAIIKKTNEIINEINVYLKLFSLQIFTIKNQQCNDLLNFILSIKYSLKYLLIFFNHFRWVDISTKLGFFEIIIKTFLLFNFLIESAKISLEILSSITSSHFILSSSNLELFLLFFLNFKNFWKKSWNFRDRWVIILSSHHAILPYKKKFKTAWQKKI